MKFGHHEVDPTLGHYLKEQKTPPTDKKGKNNKRKRVGKIGTAAAVGLSFIAPSMMPGQSPEKPKNSFLKELAKIGAVAGAGAVNRDVGYQVSNTISNIEREKTNRKQIEAQREAELERIKVERERGKDQVAVEESRNRTERQVRLGEEAIRTGVGGVKASSEITETGGDVTDIKVAPGQPGQSERERLAIGKETHEERMERLRQQKKIEEQMKNIDLKRDK